MRHAHCRGAVLLVTLAMFVCSCGGVPSTRETGPGTGGRGTEAGSDPASAQALFPPEGVDHLLMTAIIEVEIFALGKDTVELKGTVAIHRTGPLGPDGKTMKGDLIAASLRGKSAVFGEVVAMESPMEHSPCEYVCKGPKSYEGTFDINGWFWLPEHTLMVVGNAPARVQGTAQGIPPVGEKATSAFNEISLFDLRNPKQNPIGVLRRATGEIHDIARFDEYMKRP